ncbi:MAG TPA: hypothetical protein VGB78_08020 [Thermoplasmata archaeon]
MSRESRRRKTEHSVHKFQKVERSVDHLQYFYYQCKECYKVQYPVLELQKLWDYSKTNQFMFLHDWALAILYALPNVPVFGITSFVKQMFLATMEFAQEEKIPSENPGFRAYNFGPYAERIEDVVIALEDGGLVHVFGIKSPNGQRFELSDKGKQIAKTSFGKLNTEQQAKLRLQRVNWNQWGVDGLEKYIYRKWPKYTDKSHVLDRVLHRRRLGKVKWVD